MIWIALVLAVILIILLFPVKISAEYAYSNSADKHIFLVKLFSFTVFKSDSDEDKPSKEENEKKSEDKKEEKKSVSSSDVKKFIHSWQKEKAKAKKDIKKILKNIKRLANLKKAEFEMQFGFSDAAQTGIVSGILYGFVYGIFSALYRTFNINKKDMKINLKPEFNKPCFELYTAFEFKLRLIFALLAFFWIIKLYFLFKKEAN